MGSERQKLPSVAPPGLLVPLTGHGLRTMHKLAAHGKRYAPFVLLRTMVNHPEPSIDRAANAPGFKLCS
jgi:hypothetical protein